MSRKSKRLLRDLGVAFVVLLGALLAAPTFFPVDPVIQVSNENGAPLDAAALAGVKAALHADAAPAGPPALEQGAVRLRFPTIDAQLRAGHELAAAMPGRIVAFNLRPRLPAWVTAIGLKPVTLGLDLRGGVRFVYQVVLDAVSRQVLEGELDAVRAALRAAHIRAETRIEGGSVLVVALPGQALGPARRVLDRLAAPGAPGTRPEVGEQIRDGTRVLTVTPPAALLEARRRASVEQNIATLRNRVNALGVSEAVVQAQGPDRILVEVPGVQDPAQLDRVLGSTATLEWRLVDMEHDAARAARTHVVPPGSVLRYDRAGNPLLLHREIIASGEQLTDATFGYSQGRPAVFVRLDGIGAERMRAATLPNVGKRLAVVYVEAKRAPVPAAPGAAPQYRIERRETVIFAGRIDNVLSDRFQLAGLPPVEAKDLALLLRSGALAAPLFKVDSGTVSPTLGRANIAKGRLALIAGFVGVVVFMGTYYRVFGLIADAAVFANLLIVIGLLSLLPSALTLPGMAGIVLTVGMAVDANVLIFERIREELRRGCSPLASIEQGYSKAFATIADSNVTTLIAGAVLFVFGTGPIRGFAVTLSLGVLSSMFTAVVGTRVLVDLVYGRRAPKRLHIGARAASSA